MAVTADIPTKVELYGANNDGEVRRYTIADGTAVSKGDLLELTDPRTVVKFTTAAAGTTHACAGIAAEEHVANQGSTSIAVITNGVYEMMCSGAVILGAPITFCLNNFVQDATGMASFALVGAYTAGYALETGTAEEVINVRVRL